MQFCSCVCAHCIVLVCCVSGVVLMQCAIGCRDVIWSVLVCLLTDMTSFDLQFVDLVGWLAD